MGFTCTRWKGERRTELVRSHYSKKPHAFTPGGLEESCAQHMQWGQPPPSNQSSPLRCPEIWGADLGLRPRVYLPLMGHSQFPPLQSIICFADTLQCTLCTVGPVQGQALQGDTQCSREAVKRDQPKRHDARLHDPRSAANTHQTRQCWDFLGRKQARRGAYLYPCTKPTQCACLLLGAEARLCLDNCPAGLSGRETSSFILHSAPSTQHLHDTYPGSLTLWTHHAK